MTTDMRSETRHGMGRRWALGACMFAVVALTAACASGDKPAAEPMASTSAGSESSAATDSASDPASDPASDATSEVAPETGCSTQDPINVGYILPLTGPLADTAKAAEVGSRAVLESINEEGGVLGRCLEMLVEDGQGDPTTAAQAASKLLSKNVRMIYASFNSPSFVAIAPIASKAGVMAFSGGSQTLSTDDCAACANVYLASADFANSMLEFAKASSITKVAIILVNNSYGLNTAQAIEDNADGYGIEVVATAKFASGSADITSELTNLKGSGAELLLAVNYGADAVATLKARESIGWDVPVLGPNGYSFSSVVSAVGESGMQDVYATVMPKRLTVEKPGADLTPEAEKLRGQVEKYLGGAKIDQSLANYSLGSDALAYWAWAANGAESLDAADTRSYMVENEFVGAQADYSLDEDSSSAYPLSANGVIIANSFENGVFTLAPIG